MNMRRLLYWLLSAVIPLSVFAQGSSAPSPQPAAAAANTEAHRATTSRSQSAPDAAELTQFLKDFLDGAGRNDVAIHERFWADDLIYTASAGRRIGKADIMREVRAEPHPKGGEEETVYTAEDICIQQYGTTAIVAFRLVGTTKKGDKTEVANYLNTGTFLKRDGKWQVVAWQATKMPTEAEAKK
jgi:ketosteroid isomerase-like protein